MKIPDLTIEQEFEYEKLKIECCHATKEELAMKLLMVFRLLMLKDNILKELIIEKVKGFKKENEEFNR